MTQFAVIAECPRCKRGEAWSVWVGDFGQAMGTCHRATCSHGTRPLHEDQARPLRLPKKKEPRHYTRPIFPLNDRQAEMIEAKFGLNGSLLEGYNETDDRFILGVYGPVGYNRRGCIAYSLSGGTPKALTYNEKPEEPWVHYTGAGHSYVIVEDWWSAEKVGLITQATGVAIMGTHLNQAMVTELVAVAAGPTYLALDRDAYHKSIGYLNKYREQFPFGLYAWSLKQDLKYETTERIRKALDGDYDFINSSGGSEKL